ncbi:flagellar hook-associated protein FlgK [Notoacmeibacter ruber]|uniref:Flagellar hook-associated protein 1 n=1 Tax=Notoacmeibacter ruber TaxID=2670375 RepID=A0A3L7JGU5_9HYPH|nr:flagellar hook-associated protein FlgK [Notoacmeibacter ruber]RLQ88841.1 flagellar hook-associated protein FlgK [Notoacmeibacter ruber]
MSLTAALMSAHASIFDISRRVSTVSSNITRADDPNYVRRIAVNNVANTNGATGTSRAASPQLELMRRESMTGSAGAELTAEKMAQLSRLLGNAEGATSGMMEELQSRLELYAAQPADATLAQSVVGQAEQLSATIRANSQSLYGFAHVVGSEIKEEASNLQQLLADFSRVNKAVVSGQGSGMDVSDALDERSRLLNSISEIVPVSKLDRENGDMMLFTSNGVTLFDKIPRDVTAVVDSSDSSRNGVYIDGIAMRVPADGESASANGRLSSLLHLSQQTIPSALKQTDEMARSLVLTFKESDASGTLPDMAGLFTWNGGPDVSTITSHVPSMALSLSVNPAFVASQGGSPQFLRDGGANGAAYTTNAGGYSSYSERLDAFVQAFEEPFAFDATVGGADKSLMDFAHTMETGMETARVAAGDNAARASALTTSLSERFSNTVNVNLDEEISLLVDLQNSYEASSRIVSVVDEMLSQLFRATG